MAFTLYVKTPGTDKAVAASMAPVGKAPRIKIPAGSKVIILDENHKVVAEVAQEAINNETFIIAKSGEKAEAVILEGDNSGAIVFDSDLDNWAGSTDSAGSFAAAADGGAGFVPYALGGLAALGVAGAALGSSKGGDREAPTFLSGDAGAAIAENTATGVEVYTAQARDTKSPVTFSLKAGSDADVTIDPTTGRVTLRTSPDFEAKPVLNFVVLATDAAGNVSEKQISLNIANRDEQGPVISSGATAPAIGENSGSAQVVYTAAATDTDFNSPATANSITYSLKAGSDAGLTIDPSTGRVTLTGNPNYEAKNSYDFTVVATDAAGNASEKPVAFNILNADEVGPSISSGSTATAIAENSGAAQVIYTAAATDADFNSPATANSITYSLKAGSDAGLTIDPSTGRVTLTGNPNYEAKNSYNFTVVATDAAGNASEKPVAFNILNADEVGPGISSGSAATSIAENSGAAQVVYTAAATDTDFVSPATASSITYSLKAGSDAGLTINASTGTVTLTGNPDYETKSNYSFTVVATDDAGNRSEKLVALNILDRDEQSPAFTSGNTAAGIDENSGAAQLVYTAVANDTTAVVYSLKAGSDAGLTINPSTGAVTLTGNPNYEVKSGYNFTVVATDTSGNASEKAVTLNIANVDEVAPAFTSSAADITIDENSGAGQIVYTAAATDSDFNSPDTAGSITYALYQGTDPNLSIDANTGAITLAINPDYETKSSYDIDVYATDAAGNSSHQMVTLNIADVNETPPPPPPPSGIDQLVFVLAEGGIHSVGSDLWLDGGDGRFDAGVEGDDVIVVTDHNNPNFNVDFANNHVTVEVLGIPGDAAPYFGSMLDITGFGSDDHINIFLSTMNDPFGTSAPFNVPNFNQTYWFQFMGQSVGTLTPGDPHYGQVGVNGFAGLMGQRYLPSSTPTQMALGIGIDLTGGALMFGYGPFGPQPSAFRRIVTWNTSSNTQITPNEVTVFWPEITIPG